MRIVSISDIMSGHISINSKVTICGWVRNRRDSKTGVSFISIYDGSCLKTIQAIANNDLNNYQDEILKLTTGCSVKVTGVIVNSLGKGQTIELQANIFKIIGWIDDPETYPISAKKHSLEYLRKVAHLRPRTNLISAISRIRHTLAQALHRFFHENGYFWVPTPLITLLDTEGTGEMFRVSTLNIKELALSSQNNINFKQDFFGKEAFLSVSGQLNAETYACALSKIYTFGPTFRAENSNTSRHLAEFWMVEPEIAFATLDDVIVLAENMLKYVFKAALVERIEDMRFFAENVNKNVVSRLEKFIETDFIQIEYTDAINILSKSGQEFKYPISWGMNLSSEYERYLAEKYFKRPVIVKNYPKNLKAFYMRLNQDGQTVAAMDILMPGIGEIIGGSQREERLEILDARLVTMGLNKEDYWWYRDLRRYGTVPHSGFGLGFERLIAYVSGVHNVRDVIPFPRTPNNATF
ncbi:asparagine--tRNA ligase [Pantoea sp. Mhis]|uniref:asparagine--tRNA ligase n=1 Tax=Pantoea sp. Mhis TaxID=2576759 RepID=UPI001359FFA5|nr:asparagine--tRNA ligase [Pantoea sp. Mhis]MXP56138.1 asparagine--tRNA ligase [Pantoea sp. Mhis]